MDGQFLYYDEPNQLEFETQIIATIPFPGGQTAARLKRNYFYPTGGGQEHDTGLLIAGGQQAQVVDVVKDETGQGVQIILDRPLPTGPALARIDAGRRIRHMQHHTAQHLLTQCFIELFDLETVSANINGAHPSSLDLQPARDLSPAELTAAEDLANRRIFENLPVRAYFVSPQDLVNVPLRRPPKVTENIRIVEIDGYDYSACGGTHCQATGSIGLLKIVKHERVAGRTRVHFIAGLQALETLRLDHEIVSSLASALSIHPRDLPSAFERQAEQLRAAESELQVLRAEKTTWEARQLAANAESVGDRRLVVAAFPGRAVLELRALGAELRKTPGLVAALLTCDGGKLSLVVACGEESRASARELIQGILAPLGGRGGGDPSLAQGGGPAPADCQAFTETARASLQQALQ